MFRPVRRIKNALGEEATKEILRSARRGVLAVNGDGGYPYVIPINYLYDEEAGKAVRMYEIAIEHMSGKEIQER